MDLKFFNLFVDNLLSKSEILEATQSNFVVVDKDLNIVFRSPQPLEKHQLERNNLRPGDLFSCINAVHSEHGCGSSVNCPHCKLRRSIYEVQRENHSVETEVVLTLSNNTMISLLITATPFSYEDHKFIAVLLRNISDKRRIEMMEHLFFHDMLNLTGTLNNFIDLMKNDKSPEVYEEIKKLSGMIVDQVTSQRDLIYAEDGTLTCEPGEIDVNDILNGLYIAQKRIAISKNKVLDGEFLKEPVAVETDPRLLSRVLLNMIKNAMEVSESDYTIVVRPKIEGDMLEISVNNPGVISAEVAASIFHFGNTTKGAGRGIGTYSMKLIGENYLHGNVWFTSNEKDGTTFYIGIPLKFPKK